MSISMDPWLAAAHASQMQAMAPAPQGFWGKAGDWFSKPETAYMLGQIGSALTARDKDSVGYQLGQAGQAINANRMMNRDLPGYQGALGSQMGNAPGSALSSPISSPAPMTSPSSPSGGGGAQAPFWEWPTRKAAR